MPNYTKPVVATVLALLILWTLNLIYFAPSNKMLAEPAENVVDVVDEVSLALKNVSGGYRFPSEAASWYNGKTKKSFDSKEVIVLSANAGFVEFVRNFRCCLANTQHDYRYVVITSDEKASVELSDSDIKVISYSKLINDSIYDKSVEQFSNFNTPLYNRLVLAKIDIVVNLLDRGYNAILVDPDICWLRDPLPYFSRDVDFEFTPNSAGPNDERNTGFMRIAATKRSLDILRKVQQRGVNNNSNDQWLLWQLINDMLKSGKAIQVPNDFRNSDSYLENIKADIGDDVLLFRTLPFCLFPSGWLYKDGGLEKKTEDVLKSYGGEASIVSIHANWVIGQSEKKKLLQRKGYWKLSDDGHKCIGEQ